MDQAQSSTYLQDLYKVREHAASILRALVDKKPEDLIAPLRELGSFQVDWNILIDTSILEIIKKLCDHGSVVVSTVAKEIYDDWRKHEESQKQKLTLTGVLSTQASRTLPSDTTPTTRTRNTAFQEQQATLFPVTISRLMSEFPQRHDNLPQMLSSFKAYDLYVKNVHVQSQAVNASIVSLQSLLTWAKNSGGIGTKTLEHLHEDVETLQNSIQTSSNELVRLAGTYHDATLVFLQVLTDVHFENEYNSLLRKHIQIRELASSDMLIGFLYRKLRRENIRNIIDRKLSEMMWLFKKKSRKVNEALTQVAELEAKLDTYRSDIAYTRRVNLCIEDDLRRQDDRIYELKKEKANAVSQLESQVQEQRNKAYAAQKEAEKLSIEVFNLRAKFEQAEKDMNAQKKIKELESQLRDKDVMLKNRDVTIEGLKAKKQSRNQPLQHDQQEEMNHLRDELYDAQTELGKKIEELERIKEENEVLKKNVPRQQTVIQEPIIIKPWLTGQTGTTRLQVLVKKNEDELEHITKKAEQNVKRRKELEELIKQHHNELAALEAEKSTLVPGSGKKNNNKNKVQINLRATEFQVQNPGSEFGAASGITNDPSSTTNEAAQPTEDFPPLGGVVKKSNTAFSPQGRGANKALQNTPPSLTTNKPTEAVEDFPPLGGTSVKKNKATQDSARRLNENNDENPTTTPNYANVAAKASAAGVFKIVQYGQPRDQEKRKYITGGWH
ncbi:hypothetical protein DM02DRAFT_705141 [Periconia macrospinosa]|uniref:TFIIS N-terminal domain-containing protein n=1 Tax=Periconia macrospinosa TaxID=97972 RepID=A0A2V1DTK9_9PLEO|nr:hypothetical protein DM02DRAFT_705141 [Periconia macrospinosa]